MFSPTRYTYRGCGLRGGRGDQRGVGAVRLGLFGLLFGLHGRIGRGAYIIASLCLLLVFLLWGYAHAVETYAGGMGYGLPGQGSSLHGLLSLGPTYLIAFLIIFWSCFAVSIKRIHDLGHSGWWIVGVSASQLMAPAVMGEATAQLYSGVLSLVVGALLMLLKGQDGSNGFGHSPKGTIFGRGPELGTDPLQSDGQPGGGMLAGLLGHAAMDDTAPIAEGPDGFATQPPAPQRARLPEKPIPQRASARGLGKSGFGKRGR